MKNDLAYVLLSKGMEGRVGHYLPARTLLRFGIYNII